MNYAQIYNPRTKLIHKFKESNESVADLNVSSFDNKKSYSFQLSDDNLEFGLKNLDPQEISSSSKTDFKNFVQDIILNIKRNKFSKVVAAQKQVYNINTEKLNPKILFDKLVETFPETFVFCLQLDQEIWIGASPELVGVKEGNQFSTISLAGTRNDMKFSTKEREEQAIVSSTIINQLTSIGTNARTTDTKLYNYGGIQHLMNEHHIQISKDFSFQNTVRQIHPSPAIAGLPKKDSIEYIINNEKLDREFYCGLISYKIHNGSEYSFAAIRCMRILRDKVAFYAGAGITEDSNPDLEWNETIEKINTLKQVLDDIID